LIDEFVQNDLVVDRSVHTNQNNKDWSLSWHAEETRTKNTKEKKHQNATPNKTHPSLATMTPSSSSSVSIGTNMVKGTIPVQTMMTIETVPVMLRINTNTRK
jgi:hypothetical protein